MPPTIMSRLSARTSRLPITPSTCAQASGMRASSAAGREDGPADRPAERAGPPLRLLRVGRVAPGRERGELRADGAPAGDDEDGRDGDVAARRQLGEVPRRV